MLEYNEIRERKVIIYEDEPYEVVSSHVFRKQQRKPVNATKLKNLLTGKVLEISFHVSEKVEEADMSTRDIKYLYANKGEYWFCEVNDPSKRFSLPAAIVERHARAWREHPTTPRESVLVGFTAPCFAVVTDLARRVSPTAFDSDPVDLARRIDSLLRTAYADFAMRAKVMAARELLRLDPTAHARVTAGGLTMRGAAANEALAKAPPGAQALRIDDVFRAARAATGDMMDAHTKRYGDARETNPGPWNEGHALILAASDLFQRDASVRCPLLVPDCVCFVAHPTAADVKRLIPLEIGRASCRERVSSPV